MMSSSIVKQFSTMEDVFAGEGVSDEAISKAEEELGLMFSADYKSYLSAYGIAAVNGHELTGLGASPRVDVVTVTQEVRQRFESNLERLYVIENPNIDGIIYWQNSNGAVYRTVNDSEPKWIADSLVSFIIL